MINRRTPAFRGLAIASAVAVAMSLSACTSDSADGDVVVGFYPLEFLAETIGGDAIEVQSLAQPGAEPHDMELTTKQVGALSTASLVVYQRGMQPAVDDAVDTQEPGRTLDVASVVELRESAEDDGHDHGADGDTGEDHDHEDGADHDHDHDHEGEDPAADGEDHAHEGEDHADEGEDHADEGEEGHDHDHGGLDPHIWLDPSQMQQMGEAIKDDLVDIDPDNAEVFEENYEKLAAELTELDEQFTAGLAQCDSKEFVTTHTAFGYLAKAYGLEQVGILGLAAEEPSPQKLDEVQHYVDDHGVTTIFFESGVSDDYAQTVADATGAETAVLLPLETAPESGDYISAMQDNLAALQKALNCS
ncbi:metal ABC transporter substrate-binding protein [Cumulibacter soli]|uniref:metal ABC transporter substrate-binding protein n=1 Tax=Cumulibacter soli TaxID=2546344 RepID=UPI00106748A1|nr:metal ABC transporter substrate-binding protein [Cumulibacter soli]